MKRALDGIRVLDLSRMLPGPYGSMMLGDLGAEVIKIEDTGAGDPTRNAPIRIGKMSARFLQVNRNKKSIALDLKNPEGREIFLKLAQTADVILDQFRPGVVARLGIDYSVVSSLNPRIVYCSLTGYGQDGPHEQRGGHDLNYVALAGVLGLTTDDRGKPVIPGVQIADLAGGMIAAFAILAALFAREHTKRGQFIDVSMFDVVLSMLAVPAASQFAGSPIDAGGRYVLSGEFPFYNVYETGDGKYMSIGALEPKFWSNFCNAVGREDLIARQFDSGPDRERLFEEVRAIFKSRTQIEWIEFMKSVDACCEPVLSMAEAFAHAQTRAREMILQMEQPGCGPVDELGFAYKMSDTPPALKRPVPYLSEDAEELLTEIGFSEADRGRLFDAGIVRRPEPV